MKHFELSEEQWQLLLLAVGMAAGCAARGENGRLSQEVIRLGAVLQAQVLQQPPGRVGGRQPEAQTTSDGGQGEAE